jgi:outer membrane murein-binding lipoprotein Lpp
LAQRIKGRRIRQAMQEWGDLFTDMNARLATLQRDLMDVRQQLDIARSEATLAKQDSEMHRERNRLLTEDVERLKARVAELEQREKELLAAVQLANDGKAN